MKTAITILLATAGLAIADSTIDATKNFAYSGNAGWINLRPSTSDGVVFGDAFLSGYAYAANFGWIHFGDGSPADMQAYQNSSSTDYGVNHDGAGNLTGLAYAANIGWINFGWATATDPSRPQVNLSSGAFSGYAYAANIGWINLGTDLVTESMTIVDSDNDGIGDAWEKFHFNNLSTADATSNADGDEQSDLAEYLANTNPNDGQSHLELCITDYFGSFGLVTYQIQAGAGRTVIFEYDISPDFPNPTKTTYAPLAVSGTIDDLQTIGTSVRRFFRATAKLPLQTTP